jgi:nucleotide-binding universal stress UspA family protein
LQTEAIVLEGPVAESITEFAQSQDMKLVILSSHGQNGLRKWGISSVTNKIILSAPTSVLIVRAPRLEENPFRRILVPLDGSWRAENVLPMVTLLARFHKSQIQIAHVVKTPEMARHLPPVQEDIDLSNRIVARNREEALHYLDQVQLHSSLAGIDVKAHLIISDNVTLALHELVDREQIDMVALSAHGYSGNNQWPYGSVVNNFILYGKVPLLIVQDPMLRIGILERLATTVAVITGIDAPEIPQAIASLPTSPSISNGIIVANCFLGLRLLSVTDWKTFFEQISRVEKILCEDPTGIYPGMDF